MKNYKKLLLLLPFTLLFTFELPRLIDPNIKSQSSNNFDFGSKESSLALDISVNPDIYKVGPGDIFRFNMVSTSKVVTLSLQVTPTGVLLIPAIGNIDIDGLILNDVYRKVKEFCIEQYPNAKINLNLEKVKQIKINVVGAIGIKIGQITLSSTQRVSDIFEIVQNKLNEKNNNEYIELQNQDEIRLISSRHITLLRNGNKKNIDLEQFFILGNLDSNPNLLPNDILQFHLIDKYISVYGGVINNGEIEYLENDYLGNIIKLTGGFTIDSDSNFIEITRFLDDFNTKKIIVTNKINSFKINENDHIYIRRIKNYKVHDLISIDGEVNFPGIYSISNSNTTIGDLIDKCGGITQNGDLKSIIINNILIEQTEDSELRRILQIPSENRSITELAYIKARNGITKGLIKSSNQEFTNSIYNFTISSGDNIIIPRKLNYIEVIGAVKNPGRYPFFSQYKTIDYLELAGGLNENSTKNKYIIKYSTGQRYPFSINDKLESGDIIFIAEKLEYNSWTRFKDWMAIVSQVATTIIVIQNIVGN